MSDTSWQRIEPPRPAPKRVLVLGCSGMVGRAWCSLLDEQRIEHIAVRRPEFDLSRIDSIDQTINDGYDLVVNAAAWTDVDGAETDEPGTTLANATAVQRIAERCDQTGAMLISYSTDYVFSGDASEPYPIDAPIAPINAYGRSKAIGEAMIRARGEQHLLIRTSWVHAPWGRNFVLTMRSLLRNRDEIRVVDDQRGRPSSAISIANGSLQLYTAGAKGTWHLTDSGECTWHTLACHVRDRIGASCTVTPCTSDEFPRPAQRPSYSTLDISQTEKAIGPRPSWEAMVDHSLQEAVH